MRLRDILPRSRGALELHYTQVCSGETLQPGQTVYSIPWDGSPFCMIEFDWRYGNVSYGWASAGYLRMSFNNDAGNYYGYATLSGWQRGSTSEDTGTYMQPGWVDGENGVIRIFANLHSGRYKFLQCMSAFDVHDDNQEKSFTVIGCGIWRKTNAVSSIQIMTQTAGTAYGRIHVYKLGDI